MFSVKYVSRTSSRKTITNTDSAPIHPHLDLRFLATLSSIYLTCAHSPIVLIWCRYSAPYVVNHNPRKRQQKGLIILVVQRRTVPDHEPGPVPDRTPATEDDHISRAASDHADESNLQVCPQCPTRWMDDLEPEPPMFNYERFERECIASD